MLDCADFVSDVTVADWFKNEFFPSIYERRQKHGLLTRCIVSGRTVLKKWGAKQEWLPPKTKKKEAVKILPLEPFKLEHVRSTLDQRSQGRGRKTTPRKPLPNEFTRVAREVCRISGGHPHIVDSILNELARTDYKPDEAYFNRERFNNYASSVLGHAFRPLEEAYSPRAESVKECFTNLSIFRRYNRDIIEIVWTYTVDGAPYQAELQGPFENMRRCLDDSCLIRSDEKIDYTTYIGNEYRRILERQLQLDDHDKWLALHLLALAYYQDVRQTGSGGQTLRMGRDDKLGRDIAAEIESFYHSSVIHANLAPGQLVELLRSQLRENLELLHERFQFYPAHLRDENIKWYLDLIEGDDDVRSVLVDWGIQMGQDGYQVLDTLIQEIRNEYVDERAI
jgi:hypothetical protein